MKEGLVEQFDQRGVVFICIDVNSRGEGFADEVFTNSRGEYASTSTRVEDSRDIVCGAERLISP